MSDLIARVVSTGYVAVHKDAPDWGRPWKMEIEWLSRESWYDGDSDTAWTIWAWAKTPEQAVDLGDKNRTMSSLTDSFKIGER